jgi:hypothetical protein
VEHFSGRYQYLDQAGQTLQEGGCQLQLDSTSLILAAPPAAALAIDLGDVDALVAADWELRLTLYTGKRLLLRQFAKTYDNLVQALTNAYRARSIRCLLLDDLVKLASFECQFELVENGAAPRGGVAEMRIYQSNLAVLGATAQPFQWRLSDIEDVRFDEPSYSVILKSVEGQLKISRLARRTEEFVSCLRQAMADLAASAARALQEVFTFLDPDQLQSLAGLLREGGSAPVKKMAAIHPQIPVAFLANAVDQDLQPYYEQLKARSVQSRLQAGFKLIRPDEAAGAGGASQAELPDGEDTEDVPRVRGLYWFFFPLTLPGGTEPANVVAWEANSAGGRATYFFRLVEPQQSGLLADPAQGEVLVEAALRRLNRALALLNFRRRPIYLSQQEIGNDPRYHRYAIAARRISVVGELRERFLGRAIHGTLATWQAQVDAIIARAT